LVQESEAFSEKGKFFEKSKDSGKGAAGRKNNHLKNKEDEMGKRGKRNRRKKTWEGTGAKRDADKVEKKGVGISFPEPRKKCQASGFC